jgi:PPE-repeat protein
MDMNVDVDPDWGDAERVASTASDYGAGVVGFAGTARDRAVSGAVGLTTLAADNFGSGPRLPMLPGSWNSDEVASQHLPDGDRE